MKRWKIYCFLGQLIYSGSMLYGQEASSEQLEHPGINSSVIGKGHIDLEVSTSVGKFYRQYSTGEEYLSLNQNQAVTSVNTSVFYGVMKNFNVGLKYQFSGIRETYFLEEGKFVSSYTANNIGPAIRFRLFRSESAEAFLQSAALFPLDSYIARNKITYSNQFILTGRKSYNFLWSVQVGCDIYPAYGSEKPPLSVPVNLFWAYIVNTRFMPFLLVNHTTDFGNVPWLGDHKYYRLNYSTSLGVGFKYRLMSNFGFNAFYYSSIQSKNDQHFNNLMVGFNCLF